MRLVATPDLKPGTAEAGSTIAVYDGRTDLGATDQQQQRSMDLYDRAAVERQPEFHREGDRQQRAHTEIELSYPNGDQRHKQRCVDDDCIPDFNSV